MGLQLFDWVESIVGKGEIAHYEQFLFFPHNVFKSCLLFMRKNEYLCSKGLIYFSVYFSYVIFFLISRVAI